jgi:hypothetical protein
MLRRIALVLAVAGAVCACDARLADAGPVSTRNPYRSFNITGVNYGSMQWERSNGRASRGGARYGGLFFRRR